MTILSRSIRTFLFLAVLGAGPLYAQDWKGVEGILGRPGTSEAGVLRFEFPRTDLNVLVQGVPLDPQGMLASQVRFFPEDRGVRLEAGLLVLESETAKAMAQAVKNGLKVAAIDTPFSGASPPVQCLRLTGQGPRKSLARSVKMVLDSTGTPVTLEAPTQRPTPPKDPWVKTRTAFGPGVEAGGALLYQWTWMDRASLKGGLRVVLQKEGNDLALWGEIRTPHEGLDAWVAQCLAKGFQVTAVTRSGEGPEGWIDFWCLNDEKKAINILTTLLEEAGISPSTVVP